MAYYISLILAYEYFPPQESKVEGNTILSFYLTSTTKIYGFYHQFEQKSTRFWEFEEESNTWVEVKLPYDLVSCINDNCTIVNSIQQMTSKNEDQKGESVVSDKREHGEKEDDKRGQKESSYAILPLRKRVSFTKMSDTSVWVTGESGSIYERFWNGLQWVIAPHDLPV
ncbi:uncharacterized protein Fot_52077 [Forsythia ovata]|uniref:Uncharacterized protein n=1 Tax=Forsythia ovata TaxID=205694 RepID=A0ABD1PJN1_9LAMI